MSTTLLLSQAIAQYLQHRPCLSPGTVYDIRRVMRFCIEILGDLPIHQIQEPEIWRLYAELSKPDRPAYAACQALKWLKSVLTHCWRLRWIQELPRNWPKMRVPQRIPEAWTPEEVARLVSVAAHMPGQICGVRAGDWWAAWLFTAWDTALRVSQMFALRWGDLHLGRRLLVVQFRPATKSYRPHVYGLSEETCQALERIHITNGSPDKPVFPWPDWPASRRDFFSVFRYLCNLSGIPAPHHACLQLTHRLRRSSITAAAGVSLEAARKQAGHSRVETTVQHYVDPRLLPTEPVVPRLPTIGRRTLFD